MFRKGHEKVNFLVERQGVLSTIDACDGVDNSGSRKEGEDKEEGKVSRFEKKKIYPFRRDKMGELVVFRSSKLGFI